MKQLLNGITLLLLTTQFTYAQNVGIGTNDPKNKLHVAGGVRIDTLAKDSGIVMHDKNGTLSSLKLTGNSQDILTGNGTFLPLQQTQSGWQLTGNIGTNALLHFIGTSDDKPLYFRVNNSKSGQIDRQTGNTAFGYQTLSSNTSGNANTALGFRAMHTNTTGVNNIALGYMSMFNNTTGSYNTATGLNTLYNNSTGGSNTAYGYQTLYSNTTGHSNTAIGRGALYNVTTANENTAVGVGALYSNTTGIQNVATGSNTLINNTTGNENMAYGTQALYSNTIGSGNIAIGKSALYNNIEGNNNAVTGLLSMFKNSTGNNNVSNGYRSLYANTTGSGNVAIGYEALAHNITGSNNTALGTGADVITYDLTNATAIGHGAKVDASNKVRIGNAAVTAVESFGEFTKISDGRYKYNVEENVKGLDFVLKLRPVTYQLDTKAFETQTNPQYASYISSNTTLNRSYNEASIIRRTGFIAQEVEKAATLTDFN
ncbi:MAG TPA: tail fiber domain-containing protein, partial [Flavisolibacter sp.]|nr:tail fiber domain-containing protein [Flavisolibacter sp.]